MNLSKSPNRQGLHAVLVVAAFTAGLAYLTSGPFAFAAEPEDQGSRLEEIVVTAQKREEVLQNVPISISVLSGSSLDQSQFQGIAEALNAVPAVSITETYLGGTNISIRGVGAAFPFFSGPSAVAGCYLDSVPFGLVKSAIGPDADAYDMELVEV